jgi:hypothetical protein
MEKNMATKRMLFLKTVDADFKAHGGFQWPREVGGIVEAPDWNPAPECGGGLHGLLNGNGKASLMCWDDSAQWIAFEAIDADGNASDAECVSIDCGDKWKCRRARVLAVGRKEATNYLATHGCTSVHVAPRPLATLEYWLSIAGTESATKSAWRTSVRTCIEANVRYKLDDTGKFVKAT